MKYQFKREYKLIHIINFRMIIRNECIIVPRTTFRLESHDESAYQKTIVGGPVLSGLVGYLNEQGYSPGKEPCPDCFKCKERDCEHRGKRVSTATVKKKAKKKVVKKTGRKGK